MKTLILTAVLFSSLTSITPSYAGNSSGGGGDASEARVDEIRADILNWIAKDGARELKLPDDVTYADYTSKMTEILQPKKVVVTFITKDADYDYDLKVDVDGKPKTCRGFIKFTEPHIICNTQRFVNTSESDQYRLIHHEFAGLKEIEKNEEAASDYSISSQLTDYLVVQQILRLNVKESSAKSQVIFTSTININPRVVGEKGCKEARIMALSSAKVQCYKAGNEKCETFSEAQVASEKPGYMESGSCTYKSSVKRSGQKNLNYFIANASISKEWGVFTSNGCSESAKIAKNEAISKCLNAGFENCKEVDNVITDILPAANFYMDPGTGYCITTSIVKGK